MSMFMEVGNALVHTSQNGGLPPEHFAQRIMDRLIFIGDDAPEPIKSQALAYRDKMLAVILDGVKRAVENDRIYRR